MNRPLAFSVLPGLASAVLATVAVAQPHAVLLHGIREDSTAWHNTAAEAALKPPPAGEFNFTEDPFEPTLLWTHRLSEQAATLAPSMTNRGYVDDITFVGYSEGGLVSREYLRQYAGTGAPQIRTVITMGSPLAGAPILNHIAGTAIPLAGDFALASVCVGAVVEGSRCTWARVALGGVGPVPLRATAAEGVLVGSALEEVVVAEAAELAVQACDPSSDFHGTGEFRKELVRELTIRAFARVRGGA